MIDLQYIKIKTLSKEHIWHHHSQNIKNGLKNLKQNRPAAKIKKQRTENPEMDEALSLAIHSISCTLYFRRIYQIFRTKPLLNKYELLTGRSGNYRSYS